MRSRERSSRGLGVGSLLTAAAIVGVVVALSVPVAAKRASTVALPTQGEFLSEFTVTTSLDRGETLIVPVATDSTQERVIGFRIQHLPSNARPIAYAGHARVRFSPDYIEVTPAEGQSWVFAYDTGAELRAGRTDATRIISAHLNTFSIDPAVATLELSTHSTGSFFACDCPSSTEDCTLLGNSCNFGCGGEECQVGNCDSGEAGCCFCNSSGKPCCKCCSLPKIEG